MQFPFLGEVSRGPVNVRAGANTNFEIVDKLEKGTELVVLEKSYEWYKIELPSSSSVFIRADYVNGRDDHLGEVLADKVNLRARPNSESSILGQVNKGDVISLVEKVDGPQAQGRHLPQVWWKTRPPVQAVGWIHADFLRFKSAQVSAQVQKKNLELPLEVPPENVDAVAIKGVIYPLGDAATADVHYQVLVDGRPAYLLRDAKHLGDFSQATVDIEGAATGGNQSPYPILRVHKIVLVL